MSYFVAGLQKDFITLEQKIIKMMSALYYSENCELERGSLFDIDENVIHI